MHIHHDRVQKHTQLHKTFQMESTDGTFAVNVLAGKSECTGWQDR
jgi:hypothetical protein